MSFLKVIAFVLFRLFSVQVDVKLCLVTLLRILRGLGIICGFASFSIFVGMGIS